VVFELDGDTLRNAGPVYDAYMTMVRDMEDYLRDELVIVGHIVRLLGVEEAGRFLNDCDKATRERVARGGGTLAGEPLRAADLLTGPQHGILESGGVDDNKLGSLFVAMEEFWEYRRIIVPGRDPGPSSQWDTTWLFAPLSDCFMNHFGPRSPRAGQLDIVSRAGILHPSVISPKRAATRNVSQPDRLAATALFAPRSLMLTVMLRR
jgi:hypothetical protein